MRTLNYGVESSSGLNRGFQVLHTICALYIVILYFSNVPSYLYLLEFSAVSPAVYVSILLVFVFALRIASSRGIAFSSGYFLWVLAYLIVTVLWYFFTPRGPIADSWAVQRIGGSIGLIAVYVFFSGNPIAQQQAKVFMLWGLLAAVALNILDWFVPFLFVPIDSEFANPGRAAGFYVNANQAGAALVTGLILSIDALRKKYRESIVALVILGVFLTFSRSAIIACILIVVMLVRWSIVSASRLAINLLVGLAIVTILVFGFAYELDEQINIDNITERFDWFLSPQDVRDASQQERLLAARVSMDLIGDHAILGNGVGSVLRESGLGAHNAYLEYWADYGLIGLFFIPLLAAILLIEGGRRRAYSKTIFSFSMFLIFIALFTHGIVSTNAITFGVAFAAALGARRKSGWESVS